MKTYKYKIAHFTPDRLLIWSKEHYLEAQDLDNAYDVLESEQSENGYLINVDYEIVYLTEVQNEN
jgi:hypothetical protein